MNFRSNLIFQGWAQNGEVLSVRPQNRLRQIPISEIEVQTGEPTFSPEMFKAIQFGNVGAPNVESVVRAPRFLY